MIRCYIICSCLEDWQAKFDRRADSEALYGNLSVSRTTEVGSGLSHLVSTAGPLHETSKTSLCPALERQRTQLQHVQHFEEHAGFDVALDAHIARANSRQDVQACELQDHLQKEMQMFRHEVHCLEDVRAERASEAAKQKQELHLLQSEEQMKQRAWESQNAALHSQVSWLQEATAHRNVQVSAFEEQLQTQRRMLDEAEAQFRHEARCLDEVRAVGRDTAAEQKLELRVLQSEGQMQRSAWESQNAALHSEISVLAESTAQRDVRVRELQGQLHRQEQMAGEANAQFRHEVRCLEDVQTAWANKAAEQMQELHAVQSEGRLQRSASESQNAALHSEISALEEANAKRDVQARELQGQLRKQEQMAQEANVQFRHEVRCLEDMQAECESKAAEQMQELHAVQSEWRLQRSAWESQTSALHSQVSGLQEAVVQREAQARELQDQLQRQKQMLEETSADFRHKARCLDEVRAVGRDTAAEQKLELRVLQSEGQMQRSAWESQNAALHSEISVLAESTAQRDVRVRELQGQLHKQEQMAGEADAQFHHEVQKLEDVQTAWANKAAEQMQELHAVQSEGRLQRSAWESQTSALHSQVSGLQAAVFQREAQARELQDQLQRQEQMLEETSADFRHKARCLDEVRAVGRDTAAEQKLELRVLQSEGQMQRSAWESQNAALHSEISVLAESTAQRDVRVRELQGQLHKQEQMAGEANAQFRHEVRCFEDMQAECESKAAEQMQELHAVQSEGRLQRSASESQNAALHSEISALEEANAKRDVQARELQGQLRKQEQMAQEANVQVRHEVRCLEDMQAECESKAAEQMQELRVVQSEGRLQRSAWESQTSALHSHVSDLREALCQRDVLMREMKEQVEVEQAEVHNVQQQVLEEAGAKRRYEARCLAEAAEARAALLQAESHAAQKGQFWEQHRTLEVAEVQFYHKLEMCEDATAESRTKHQHVQAESQVLSLECEELNTRWLGATETIGCLELDTQKLESQVERFRSIERERAEADAQGRLVKSQLWRLEREESTCKQALAASRAASSRHEQQLCEQEEDLCHVRLEHHSAQIRQRALESQNEALQSWCSSLQEQNLQLESVRTEEEEMHWLSEYREAGLLRQRLLQANESQADAFGREATLCEEVNCLREANAAFEDTMGEIKCRHQQLQAESESRRSECEELTASWLSAREEVDSMRLGMRQLKAQIRNAQEKNEQLVVDCKAFKKECAENQEQSARLQLHVRQCRMQLAALQQEAVMEGSHFLRPASQVQRSIWDSRNAGLRSQVPGKGISSDAPRAVQAYEFLDQLQTDKELSEGMFPSSAEPECALLLPALAWRRNKGGGAHDASLQVHAEEHLHRLSHQSIWNPATRQREFSM